MSTPTVTIGLPVYNAGTYLTGTLDALLLQEFADFELVISDNASTDATSEICERYSKGDPRIRYFRTEVNRGAAWNFNRVFQLARGQYFKWSTHDDLCLPGFLGRCVSALDAAPASVILVYPRARFIDGDGTVIGVDRDILDTRHMSSPHRRLARILTNLNLANAVEGLIRSKVLRQTRLIGSFIASDYVLLAELAMLGEFLELPDVLFHRRLHKGASRAVNRTNAEVLSWFDPTQALRYRLGHVLCPRLMVRSRLLYEWLRSASSLPLSRTDRMLCLSTIPLAYGAGRARTYGGLWRHRVAGMVRRAVTS